jgi:NADH dehydrogenase FAD-containing subunit
VLVIGAGYAGAVCAATLAAANAADAAANANTTPPLLTVTLVDPRDHLDSAFTHARALVEPSIAGRALLPLDAMRALPSDTVRRVRASVVALPNDKEAKLSDGSTVAFDYAVIAAGSSYAFGKSAPQGSTTGRKERLAEIEAAAALFFPSSEGAAAASSSAKNLRVLVVGGGPLGVEAAAELLTDAPAVGSVTLVQSSDRLLPSLPCRAGTLAKRFFEGHKRRCRLVLGRRIRADDPLLLAAEAAMRGNGQKLPEAAREAGLKVVGGVVVAPTEGGAAAALEPSGGGEGDDSTIPYDLAIVATGILRNTSFLQKGALESALVAAEPGGRDGGSATAQPPPPPQAPPRQPGAVRVDASLRVPGFSNVFAAGDCTDVPEEKLAFLASAHGELVANNVVALAKARRAAAAAAASEAAFSSSPPVAPPPPVLRTWRPSSGLPVCIVTLGRAYAIMCVGPLAAAGWLPTKLKASNLLAFVDKYRKRLGVRDD